ncbi:hypothetical protein LRS10_19890 [Phenylobacterium sp. J426]|uniref:hypothetical protein n=1 Tax=Phenylobacterium sp. J426 TaxID=2898439 RepID=UPI00215078DE|nr:hypothetical protein [Phenylobacterium sp. J426]MCR5876203.1 hypothetical protein [Phenylobacterium sp. J426]
MRTGSREPRQTAHVYFGMASSLRKLGYAHGHGPLREALLEQAFGWTLLANTVLARVRAKASLR